MPGFGFPCEYAFTNKRNTEGQLAQLVEQRIENPRVLGSIPRLATKQINALHALLLAAHFHFRCHVGAVQDFPNPSYAAHPRAQWRNDLRHSHY